MNIEFEAQLLKQLGFTIEPDNLADPSVEDDCGWLVSHASWEMERQCESRYDIALWLYSLGVSLYPQYLAVLRFREILSGANEEVIEGLRLWHAGNRVSGAAETVVDEVLRLSRQDVVLAPEIWRHLALEMLLPHMQPEYLSTGMHIALEFEAFMHFRPLDGGQPKGLISSLWKRFSTWNSRIGLSHLWAWTKELRQR